MAKIMRRNGSTSNILRIFIEDAESSVKAGKTGIASDTSGLVIATIANNEATAVTYTVAGSTIETISTLGTYAAPTATKCRFKEVDSTNLPGIYELQLADARFAVSSAKSLFISIHGVANAVTSIHEIDLAAQIDTNTDAILSAVNNIATTGVAAYEAAASFTKTVGGTEVGTYANTDTSNGSYHQIPDSGGVLNVYYQYALRPDESAVGVVFKGRMTGTGDNVSCQAYDWTNSAWVTLFTVTGVNTTTDQTNSPALVSKYTGTGENVGLVRIRFYAASGLTSANLYVDQCIIAKTNINRGIGYSNGYIWVKATGTSGTTVDYNGTVNNPCPWADALTLNLTLGLNRYAIVPGTTVTLDAALANSVMTGHSYILALGGQNVSGSYFEGVEGLSGTGTCSSQEAIFFDCHINALNIGEADFVRCHLMNTITMAQASVPYRFHDCSGISSAKITFAAASQSSVISRVSGVLTIAGMVSTNTLYIDGDADVTFDNTNNAGVVYIAGNIRLTNNGVNMSITDTARWSEDQSVAAVSGAVASVTGHVGGNVVGSIGSLATQAKADVNAEADSALSDYDPPTKTELDSAVAPLALASTATAIKAKTDNLPASPAAVGSAMTLATGAITADVVATGAIDADALSTDAITEIWSKAMTELSAVPAVTGTVLEALEWVFLNMRNKMTQTSSTKTLRNSSDSGNIATATTSSDGTTFTHGAFS